MSICTYYFWLKILSDIVMLYCIVLPWCDTKNVIYLDHLGTTARLISKMGLSNLTISISIGCENLVWILWNVNKWMNEWMNWSQPRSSQVVGFCISPVEFWNFTMRVIRSIGFIGWFGIGQNVNKSVSIRKVLYFNVNWNANYSDNFPQFLLVNTGVLGYSHLHI
jgi:hypothetical protein